MRLGQSAISAASAAESEVLMSPSKVRVGILGASGYAGGELLRLLHGHQYVEVVWAASPSGEGRPIAEHHPALRGLTKLPLSPVPQTVADWPELDCLFLCLPHGASRDLVPKLPLGPKIIDLGGDFRLTDAESFAKYYGTQPADRDWQKRFVYGLPETTGAGAVAAAQFVANPGCFATTVILALAPLVRSAMIEDRVIVDAKTGSTGSGAKPSATTQHATRVNSMYAYKSFSHQHLPEIRQALAQLSPGWGGGLVFQAHSTPLVRGIFASVYCQLKSSVTAATVTAAFKAAYTESAFIRLVDGSPNVNWSRGSNFVDIGWVCEGRELSVFATLDNLGKGAAGQAVQNMNLMFSLPETTGLWQAGGAP